MRIPTQRRATFWTIYSMRATAKTLVILDRGFYDFLFFVSLIAQQIDFITRLKSNASMEVVQILSESYRRERTLDYSGLGRPRESPAQAEIGGNPGREGMVLLSLTGVQRS